MEKAASNNRDSYSCLVEDSKPSAVNRPEVSIDMDEAFILQQAQILAQFAKSAPRTNVAADTLSTATSIATPTTATTEESTICFTSGEDEEDWDAILSDPKFVEAQKALFDAASQPVTAQFASLKAEESRNADLPAEPTISVVKKATKTMEDSVRHLTNGQRVRVKGLRRAYKSVEKGSATIVTCIHCRTMMQVSDTARNVYCVCCQQVMSMEACRDFETSATASCQSDEATAAQVQRQEREIAAATKGKAKLR